MNQKKVERGSPLSMYGRKEVFQKRFEEGFDHFKSGGGPWVEDDRIVAIFVMFHPDGRIATFETPKGYMPDGMTTYHPGQYEQEYTEQSLQEHLERFKIKLGDVKPLQDLLEGWD